MNELRQKLEETYKKNEEDIPENINELKPIELNELIVRSEETSKPRKCPYIANQSQQREMLIEEYENPYVNLNINTNAGFQYTEGSEQVINTKVIRGFVERDYHNDDNILVINLFIAIRHFISQVIEEAKMISVRIITNNIIFTTHK